MTDTHTAPGRVCSWCWRGDYLVFDGSYWTVCHSCGKRNRPGEIRKTIRIQKERAR